jgi:hypothetical protein
MESVPCTQCGASLKPYWLRNGVCGGCRDPQSIVVCIPATAPKPIQHAIGRLETALRYGSDMESSRAVCLADAKSLLAEVESTGLVRGAVAALSQNKTFPADIRLAISYLQRCN